MSESVGPDINEFYLACILVQSLHNVRLSLCVNRAGHWSEDSQRESEHVDSIPRLHSHVAETNDCFNK